MHMTTSISRQTGRQLLCHLRARRGFTFTEILFAVMILGIGFIMIAAVFPVALKQTDETVTESVAASLAKEAGSIVSRMGQGTPAALSGGTTGSPLPSYDTSNYPYGNFPPTFSNGYGPAGGVVGTDIPLKTMLGTNYIYPTKFWSLTAGNMILSVDSRFAFVPFYLRNDSAPPLGDTAEVILIAVKSQNAAGFTAADLTPQTVGTSTLANLQGRELIATFTYVPAGIDTVQLYADGPGTANNFPPPYGPASALDPGTGTQAGAVATGCYMIIADDNQCFGRGLQPPFSCNGYVYKIGSQAVDANNGLIVNSWNLVAGNDMHAGRFRPCLTPATGVPSTTSKQVRVYVVGRGFANSGTATTTNGVTTVNTTNSDTTFTGAVMDVAAFCTFIKPQ